MCLHNIDKKPKQWDTGYKVFHQEHKDELRGIYQRGYEFKTNEEIIDIGYWNLYLNNSESIESTRYPTGFHFFKNKKDAEEYIKIYADRYDYYSVVRKITVNAITATGTQFGYDCGVAKQIFIHPEEE